MFKSFFSLVVIILALSCTSCRDKSVSTTNQKKKDDFNRFSYEDHGNFRTMHVFKDKHRIDTLCSYVLYHSGTQKPIVNFNAFFVETPVKNAVCLSNIYVGCLEKLGLTDKIVAVDNHKNICNSKIRDAYSHGKIKQLAVSGELDIEQTLTLHPDVIFNFGTGEVEKDLPQKIITAAIPVAVSFEYRETDPLRRAAWLKFVAAFFEKEKLADSILAGINKRYQTLKNLVAPSDKRPRVFTEIMYKDTWFVPGGKSYIAALLKDAGADYLWSETNSEGSIPLSYEAVFARASQADFWLHVQFWKNLSDATRQDIRNAQFRSFKIKQVYNNDLKNTSDGAFAYWESGLLEPDELLKDLIRIFYPEKLPDHQFTYYRKLN